MSMDNILWMVLQMFSWQQGRFILYNYIIFVLEFETPGKTYNNF